MWTDARRAVRELIPDAELIHEAAPADELMRGAYDEPPTVRAAHVLEGTILRAVRVVGVPTVTFAGFLDGIQRVQIVGHRDGMPLIWGVVGAAIRARHGRRLTAWGHRPPQVEARLYVPWAYLREPRRASVGRYAVVDTTAAALGPPPPPHPAALRAVALRCVGADREALERALAERWCGAEHQPLYVDGSLTVSRVVAESPCAVGVVKSHTTLHVDGDALRVVMGLRARERSSVVVVESGRRPAVASWYLRLRDPQGHDAMFGLVRVEVAIPRGDPGARAEEVSRWVLGEGNPVALPDGRWDRMAYGVRDCEEFLRAVAS